MSMAAGAEHLLIDSKVGTGMLMHAHFVKVLLVQIPNPSLQGVWSGR